MIFNLPNPIPYTILDPDELNNSIGKFDIIPYYGTTETSSHIMLELFQTLTNLSPTFNSVLDDLNTYTFGSRIKIVNRAIPGLDVEATDLEFDDQVAYESYLGSLNIKLKTIIHSSKRLNRHLNTTGNGYIHIKRVRIAGVVRYQIKIPHYKHVAYQESKDPAFDFLLISKFIGDLQRMEKFPPTIIPATQIGQKLIWTRTAKNIDECIIHIKRDDDHEESDIYARSPIASIMTWLYVDYQKGNMSSKIAATEIISKLILAFQAPDPNTEDIDDPEDHENGNHSVEYGQNGKIGGKRKTLFQRNMMVLKELTTQLGDHPSIMGKTKGAASIAGLEYPHSGIAPTSIPLELNRDTNYDKHQQDSAIQFVCIVLRWAPELIMARQTKTQLGGNLLYDIFTMKNESVIVPSQCFYEDIWNDILNQIIEEEGGPSEFDNFGIKFPDVIVQMIEKFKGSGSGSVGQQLDSNADPSNPEIDIDGNGNTDDT